MVLHGQQMLEKFKKTAITRLISCNKTSTLAKFKFQAQKHASEHSATQRLAPNAPKEADRIAAVQHSTTMSELKSHY